MRLTEDRCKINDVYMYTIGSARRELRAGMEVRGLAPMLRMGPRRTAQRPGRRGDGADRTPPPGGRSQYGWDLVPVEFPTSL